MSTWADTILILLRSFRLLVEGALIAVEAYSCRGSGASVPEVPVQLQTHVLTTVEQQWYFQTPLRATGTFKVSVSYAEEIVVVTGPHRKTSFARRWSSYVNIFTHIPRIRMKHLTA